MGLGFLPSVCYIKSIPTHEKIFCCGKKCPKCRFQPNFPWVGLALGWGAGRFHSNMYIFSNSTGLVNCNYPTMLSHLVGVHAEKMLRDAMCRTELRKEWQVAKIALVLLSQPYPRNPCSPSNARDCPTDGYAIQPYRKPPPGVTLTVIFVLPLSVGLPF